MNDENMKKSGEVMKKEKPSSCIECPKADCTGYCRILNDRQEDYALKIHKDCPLEGEENG